MTLCLMETHGTVAPLAPCCPHRKAVFEAIFDFETTTKMAGRFQQATGLDDTDLIILTA